MAEQRTVNFQNWLNTVAPEQQKNREIQVPAEFRPFKLEEVVDITGCLPVELERWMRIVPGLALQVGDDNRTTGLNYMQTLAVFVGVKYMYEEAPQQLADAMVNFVTCMNLPALEEEIAQGRTILAPQQQTGLSHSIMLEAIGMPPLAKRLQMSLILAEFKERLDRAFPKTAIIPVS